jgi:tRNA-specific 2-thiouridylase
MYKNTKKIVVAVSGGVDSSVSAYLLKQAGYDVTGVFMKLDGDQAESERAARTVCQQLGIKFYPVNLHDKFKLEVIDYFLSVYQNGRTPNPCVRCNKLIKFGELLRVADELKADFLATGHYVRVEEKQGIFSLHRGVDMAKDQSYFLYNMTQDILKRLIFPVGKFEKAEIKKIAEEDGIPHLKKESQDVCFLNQDGKEIEHNEYLKKYLQLKSGPILTLAGEKVGEHQGLPLYTIGQRKGIDIGGIGPFYVARADYENNVLYVTNDANDPALYAENLLTENTNWVSGIEPSEPFECEAVIRYHHQPVKCTVGPSRKAGEYMVELKKAERAITSGQSCVFYLGDEVIGGGIIA